MNTIYTYATAACKESRLQDILTEKMQANIGPRTTSTTLDLEGMLGHYLRWKY